MQNKGILGTIWVGNHIIIQSSKTGTQLVITNIIPIKWSKKQKQEELNSRAVRVNVNPSLIQYCMKQEFYLGYRMVMILKSWSWPNFIYIVTYSKSLDEICFNFLPTYQTDQKLNTKKKMWGLIGPPVQTSQNLYKTEHLIVPQKA